MAILMLMAVPTMGDELKGELLVTSDYVWRGISLSEDAPAVIGGFDYTHDKGWFALAKVANVSVAGSAEQEGIMQAGFSRPKGA